MTDAPIPTVLAMLLCDLIIIDAETSKKTLVGIFDRFSFPKLPASYGGFALFARMTDAEGKYRFMLRFVRLEDDKLLMEAKTNEIEPKDRLGFCDLVMRLPPLPLEQPGRHEFQLYANDVYVARTMVDVQLATQEQT